MIGKVSVRKWRYSVEWYVNGASPDEYTVTWSGACTGSGATCSSTGAGTDSWTYQTGQSIGIEDFKRTAFIKVVRKSDGAVVLDGHVTAHVQAQCILAGNACI